jgi:hypothetical protein
MPSRSTPAVALPAALHYPPSYTCYCMHMLSHRLQLLLDEDRYQRVASLARQRKISVAAVIREAIDHGLPATPQRRGSAAKRILVSEPMQVGEPEDLAAEIDELRGRRL